MAGLDSSRNSISELIEYLWREARLSREIIGQLFKSHPPEFLFKTIFRNPHSIWNLLPNIPKKDRPAVLPAFLERSCPFKYLTPSDSPYPHHLMALPDPPWVLYYQGNFNLLNFTGPRIAVVGTRRATKYGLEMTQKFIEAMGPYQPLIVSGMALGVDGEAHRNALKLGLPTVAVLGTPLGRPYPWAHGHLYRRMEEEGLLVSEVYPGARMGPWRFPERNRILAALAEGVLVVEAPLRSGALDTAQHALEMGKEVFVIPGPLIPRHANEGGHRLIQQGAHLVTHPREIFSILGYELQSPIKKEALTQETGMNAAVQASISEKEAEILKLLANQPLHIDKIVEIGQKPAPSVVATLMGLSLKGWVQELPGGIFKIIK